MHKYAVLQNPGHNRVYFDSSKKLSLLELTTASEIFSSPAQNIDVEVISGVDYFTFETENPLNADDLTVLSRLSFVYALFEVKTEPEIYFLPVLRNVSYYFSDDISMILKYSGKTNELFTRFLLNMAVMTYHKKNKEPEVLNILDPVCGKGTALFESLIMGHNAHGVDIDKKSIHEAQIYFKKYLETGRYKHSFHVERISGNEKISFEVPKNKDDAKTGKSLSLSLVAGNSQFVNNYYKKNMFHIIVGDLPYGVQHGSTFSDNTSRNPSVFLDAVLPEWLKVLMPGGVLVLSWNNFVLSRPILETLIKKHGLTLVEYEPRSFEHRVDQAINRDVIIAVHPQ